MRRWADARKPHGQRISGRLASVWRRRFRVINISIENISIGNYINFLGNCQAKYEKNNFVPFEKLKNVEKCSIIGVSFAKGDGEGD